jgi:hypothetical protein
MGPYAEVDYNLTLCPLQSRLPHIYHGQPYDRIDLNPNASVDFIPPVRDFRFGLGQKKRRSCFLPVGVGPEPVRAEMGNQFPGH